MPGLLYKLMRLTAHPMTYLFCLSGVMLLIPNYPYSVVFFYSTLGIFFMMLNVREQRDADYSALLPVTKKQTVKATVLFTVICQAVCLVLAVPFMLLSRRLNPMGNAAGVDANVAALGMGCILFGFFNGIFFPAFYRTGYKVGTAFLKANIGAFLVLAGDVVLPHVPGLQWLDGQTNTAQLLLFAGALIWYGVLTSVGLTRSEALYEKVDL